MVGKVEGLVEVSGVLDEVLLHVLGLLRLADNELLDLIELVDSEDTPGILAVGTSLLTEVGGEAGVPRDGHGRKRNT